MGKPGDDGQSTEGGENHGNRYIGCHGSHVRPHHSRYEEQGRKTDNDGQGGHDHRRQYLAYGKEGRIHGITPPLEDMPLDIVDIGDGVVHHKPQRQNQGKKGYPVDGIAQQIIDEQSQ